jgi:Fic family protein
MTSRDYFNAVLNAHISDEMDAVSTEMIARLDAKNAKRRSTESKDKREARERREAVLNFLCNHQGEEFARDQIAEAVSITPAQVSAACKTLVADDTITKSEAKVDKARRVVYSYPVEE